MTKRLPKLQQLAIWGGIIKEESPPTPSLIPLDFQSHQVRLVTIAGEPWFVAADVCKVLEIANSRRALASMPEHWKGVHAMNTPGGTQSLAIISESGLYRLVMRSDKKSALPFQDWVCGEVLPEIRRTGGYVPKGGRVAKEAKRLRCDQETAKIRCDQFTMNKSLNREMADQGACPRDLQAIHNAIYIGQLGNDAKGLREKLGLKSYRASLLDRLGALPLSNNQHAKVIFSEVRKHLGADLPMHALSKLAEEISRNVSCESMQKLGPEFVTDIVNHPERGAIIEVTRSQLSA